MALAERLLNARLGPDLVDHHTYCLAGDGCLMEGISHEAISLAGHLKLGKLIVLFDDNSISIDGATNLSVSDDQVARFSASGWNTARVDGHDTKAVSAALAKAKADSSRPWLIACKTVIGFGAPNKQGSESTHGAPLGKDEIAAARLHLGWEHAPFVIPEAVYQHYDARPRGAALQVQWNELFARYAAEYPELGAEFQRRLLGDLPADFDALMDGLIAGFDAEAASIASRKASQRVLEAIVGRIPELIGGSADLAHSNYSIVKASRDVKTASDGGNYVYYGVREFGMTAIANGLALHGCILPFTATFLVFSDYARNAVRMSALMHIRAIHVYTHDSIGLGEDGPTHQPVEHLASLRYIPNNRVWRPADAVESAVAWKCALERRDGPACLAFSRQNLAHQFRTPEQIAAIARGGYVLSDSGDGRVDLIVMATGSELELGMQLARTLSAEGHAVRVVSMPCTEAFDAQPIEYRESVLPGWCRKRIAIEAGVADFWRKYVGLDGAVIGLDRFGASAPDKVLYAYLGFGIDRITDVARNLLGEGT
jgi:transketolase